ncbi:unnamed protein product [Paramecium sonneborni]|uniref:Translation initiation factor eIF-2B subunit delta n=1 Tax=Paramecium sonneborni TaxID=65129 RepID=A0A8S1R848_9CILI|nr:unnamed protein product [Paramecium sonneborni]
MSEQQNQQNPKKWQPKEKFDKKANKEKQKQEQEKAEIEKKQESNKESNKQESNKAVQKQNSKVEQQQQTNQQQQAVNNKQIVQIDGPMEQNKRKDFLSHLPIFQDYSSESIKSVKQIDPQTLHHSFIELCIQYQNGQCIGSTHRCVEFLNALKQFIKDYKLPRQSNYFAIAFLDELKKIFNLMKNFRTVNEGMSTSYLFINECLMILRDTKLDENESKIWLCNQIDQFIQSKIIAASELIIKNATQLIQEGTTILVYARSYLIENFIINYFKQGKQLTIFVVDNPQFGEGSQLVNRLQQQGISCYQILLSHVSYILSKVDKILVGASSMLCNGALISRVGTALLACLASTHKIPFLVFCESYKFSEKSQIDSLSWNEIAQLQQENEKQQYTSLSLRYDITQSNYINMIVTEVGLIPATSVKAVIGEFKKYNYVDAIEIPRKYQQ